MPLRLHAGQLDAVVAGAVSTPPAWVVVGGALGLIAGAIALVTALINRQTAKAGREAQRAEPGPAKRAGEPGVFLPPRPQPFVDRTEALEQAVTRLRAGEQLVAIEGTAGVGKSAVARELVHRLSSGSAGALPEPRQHHFLWIDGRDGWPTLADICREIVLLTGDQSLSSVADDAKLHALRGYLARNRTVLLLDNLRLAPGRAADPLQELLHSLPKGSRVIASVNSPFPLEKAFRVLLRELEPDHVAELIRSETRRLGLGDPDRFDVPIAARLQAAVGGNPLAIEAFLRALVRSPASIDELLAAVERGEGLENLFRPVWSQLPDDARIVLGACAYLRGEAVSDVLAIACSTGPHELSAALSELMQAGLVTVMRGVRPEIYACDSTVQRFALAETPADTITAFTRRLTTYYVRQFAGDPENAQWAIPHIAAIKAVLEWLFDRGDDAELQALFASTLDILLTLGLLDDRIQAGQLAYESAMRAGNARGASLATDVLSSTHAARGELKAAREAAALGMVAAERSSDPGERARQMRAHALTLYKARDAAGAVAALDGADELARGTGDLEIVVNVLGLRTVAHWYDEAYDDSRAAAERGLEVCREMGWQRAQAYPLRNLAEVAAHQGELDDARALVEQARQVAVEFGDRRQLARVHLTSARISLFNRDPRAAAGEAAYAHSAAQALGLTPEGREARAIRVAAIRARLLPPLRRYYARRRPARFTDAPIGGD